MSFDRDTSNGGKNTFAILGENGVFIFVLILGLAVAFDTQIRPGVYERPRKVMVLKDPANAPAPPDHIELRDKAIAGMIAVAEQESKWSEKLVVTNPLTGKKHDFNPAPKINWKPADKKYVDRFAKTAVEEMKQFGIPASITLAQGLIESNAGTSFLADTAKNHFGIKCHEGKKCKKGHCINRPDDHHKDFFLMFKTPWESFRHHSKFIANQKRYKRLFDYGKDYKLWATGLQRAGYATSKTYASDLIKKIEQYQLYRFDH